MNERLLFTILFALFIISVGITLSQMKVTTLFVISLGAFLFILADFIRTKR